MSTIEELLTEREDHFDIFTLRIVNQFSEKLTKVMQFYLKTESHIYWDSVEPMHGLASYLKIIGHINGTPGETVKTETSDVLITDKNKHLYRKLIKLTIPTRMLDECEFDSILQYVKDIAIIAPLVSETDLIELLSQVDLNIQGSLLQNPKFQHILDKATKPEEVLGFTATELSDDQILMAKMFENYSIGNC